MTDLLPDDDSFVRTAIQGLRVPPHGPDFWDQLAWQLDDAADDMASQGLMEEVLRSALLPDLAELAQPEPSPHHVEDPWPGPVAEPAAPVAPDPATEAVDLFAPVDEPVYEDEYEEDRADDAAAYEPAYDEPAPRGRSTDEDRDRTQVWAPAALPSTEPAAPRARPDRSVVPHSLRRTSNLVLLVVALLAAVLAVVAGLGLVRQRSDSASPPSSEQAIVAPAPAASVVASAAD